MGRMGRIVTILALAATGAATTAAAAADFAVGFVGDLSGVGANMAQDELDGFKLGIKHLGGRLAGNEFTLSVADSQHDWRIARAALERMQQSERLQILLLSLDTRHVGQLLGEAIAGKTLVISLNNPPANLAGKDCNPSFFSLASLPETLHELGGLYLQQRGYKTVVVAGPANADARNAAQAFRRGFKGQVVEIYSRRGEMNFSADLRAIRQASPDAVYLLYSGGMAVNFIRQSAESLGQDRFPLFGPPTVLDQTVLAASGPAALGLGSVGSWSEDIDNPTSRRLQNDFEGDYGRPASLYAAIGYDAAMLLDGAYKIIDKKAVGEDALRGALRRVEIPSTRGAVRFDADQFVIQTFLSRQVVQDARERMVNEQHGVFQKDVRARGAGECPIRWSVEPPPKG